MVPVTAHLRNWHSPNWISKENILIIREMVYFLIILVFQGKFPLSKDEAYVTII